jgi:hypothetical protein
LKVSQEAWLRLLIMTSHMIVSLNALNNPLHLDPETLLNVGYILVHLVLHLRTNCADLNNTNLKISVETTSWDRSLVLIAKL